MAKTMYNYRRKPFLRAKVAKSSWERRRWNLRILGGGGEAADLHAGAIGE
jgi:hypothetical protein